MTLTFTINSTRMDHNDVEQPVVLTVTGTYHRECGPSWDDPGCPSEFEITGATGEDGEEVELTDDEMDAAISESENHVPDNEYEQNDPSDFDSDEDF